MGAFVGTQGLVECLLTLPHWTQANLGRVSDSG